MPKGDNVKQYRPHILVMIALAFVLSCGLARPTPAMRWPGSAVRWQSRQASGDIVIVAIDALSIDKVGVWPGRVRFTPILPRRLQQAEVRDIALDVDFSTPSNASSDDSFAEALESAGGSVILPSFQQPGINKTTIHFQPPAPASRHAWPAIVNVEVGPDGLVRRYPFGQEPDGKFLPSMGAVLAGRYDAKRAPLSIDFGIWSGSIPKVSYVDVLRGEATTLNRLKGKKVIIGGTALELGDRFSIPNGEIVSGPILNLAGIDIAEPCAAMDLGYRHAGGARQPRTGDAADLAPPVRR